MREKIKCEGAATYDDLEGYSAGLVCLTGGDEGPLAAAIVNGGEEAGREAVERLVTIFGKDSVYVEVQRHREREEEWRNQAAIRIAQSMKLPVIATNGVRYATAYDREILDVFTAIRHHTDLDHAGRLLALNTRRHLRSAREMAALFRDVPGAIEQSARRWTAFSESASPKA
jgi:error-prone DNA polymerase